MSDIDLGSNIEPAPVKIQKSKAPPPELPARVKIILEENEHIPATGLFIQVNGFAYMLKAGVEAEVPASVREVLDHAVQTTPIMDPDTRRPIGYRDSRRFPYRLV